MPLLARSIFILLGLADCFPAAGRFLSGAGIIYLVKFCLVANAVPLFTGIPRVITGDDERPSLLLGLGADYYYTLALINLFYEGIRFYGVLKSLDFLSDEFIRKIY